MTIAFIKYGVTFDSPKHTKHTHIMKIQCNVCHESPIVDVVEEPNHTNDLVCCPSCSKQLAYATEKKYSNNLIWKPVDTEFNKEFGIAPVKVIIY